MRTIRKLIVPKQHGEAFELHNGQILRIVDHEGQQVTDINAWNLRDFREKLSCSLTTVVNRSVRRFDKIYSAAPRGNIMFEIIHDDVGVHWCSGRCNSMTYKVLFGADNHINCQDIIADVIKPWGLTPFDVHDAFAVFMNVEVTPDGRREIQPPPSKKGDRVDLLAKMDLLVALSACPNDIGPTNNYSAKSVSVEILERD